MPWTQIGLSLAGEPCRRSRLVNRSLEVLQILVVNIDGVVIGKRPVFTVLPGRGGDDGAHYEGQWTP